MEQKKFRNYYLFAVVAVFAASFYPLYMAISVVSDVIRYGGVPAENFPKYIIPYAPISLAVLLGTVLMPLFMKYCRRFALPATSVLALGVFFLSEYILERKVTVLTDTYVVLESWQMGLCYVPPEMFQTRVWEAVDVLLGGYSPAFKLHFYAISVVLILVLLSSVYGFGWMVKTGDATRKKPLTLQTTAGILFLGLCIWACFTSFYRTGELLVGPLSAVLMSVFFIVFGLTMGMYAGSFLYGKQGWLAVAVPSLISATVTIVMYVGELILLSGHLYRFGTGSFYKGLGPLVLAPVDLVVIALSGGLCALILIAIRKTK